MPTSRKLLDIIHLQTDIAKLGLDLGGDEFGILLSPVEDQTGVQAAADRHQAAIEAPFSFEGRDFPLRSSIGAAHYPGDGEDPLHLLDLADQRMYAAKQARKLGGGERHEPRAPVSLHARLRSGRLSAQDLPLLRVEHGRRPPAFADAPVQDPHRAPEGRATGRRAFQHDLSGTVGAGGHQCHAQGMT
jgi:hypothetical protein